MRGEKTMSAVKFEQDNSGAWIARAAKCGHVVEPEEINAAGQCVNCEPMTFGKELIGCIIDGIGKDANWLNGKIVEFAIESGFVPSEPKPRHEDREAQVLREAAADALAWLNGQDLCLECSFVVREDSLMYLHEFAKEIGQ
jgi:hypothetical protein